MTALRLPVLAVAALAAAAALVPGVSAGCHDSDKQKYIAMKVALGAHHVDEADKGIKWYCNQCVTNAQGLHGQGQLNPEAAGSHDCAWHHSEKKCYRRDKNWRDSANRAATYATDASSCERYIHKQAPGATCEPTKVYIFRHGKVYSPSGYQDGQTKTPMDPLECVRAFHLKPQGDALAAFIDTTLGNDALTACNKLEVWVNGVDAELKQTHGGRDQRYKRDPYNRCKATAQTLLTRCAAANAGAGLTVHEYVGGTRTKAHLHPRRDFTAAAGSKSLLVVARHIEMVGGKDNDAAGSSETVPSLLEDFGFELPMEDFGGRTRNAAVYSGAARAWTQNNYFVVSVAADCAVTRTIVPLANNHGENSGTYGADAAVTTYPNYATLRNADNCIRPALWYSNPIENMASHSTGAKPYSEWITENTAFAFPAVPAAPATL